jgi:heme a synthase
MVAMEQVQRRMVLLHRLAWTCAVLVLAITSLSAFMRLSRAGLGCEPWPQCQVQRAAEASASAPAATAPPESAAVTGARIGHRIAASTTLVLIVALLMIALARQPTLLAPGRIVLALLGLALFLAILGRLGADSPAPGVVLGNLLGGIAMFALTCRLVLATRPRTNPVATSPWVLAALALLVLQLAMGGLASAGHVVAQCDASLLCQAHRGAGLLTALVLASLAAAVWRRRPYGAAVLLLLVLAQAGLGVAMLALAPPLPLALAHNVVAVLLVGALVALI